MDHRSWNYWDWRRNRSVRRYFSDLEIAHTYLKGVGLADGFAVSGFTFFTSLERCDCQYSFILTNATLPFQTGQLRCVARNCEGEAVTTATLTVTGKPTPPEFDEKVRFVCVYDDAIDRLTTAYLTTIRWLETMSISHTQSHQPWFRKESEFRRHVELKPKMFQSII